MTPEERRRMRADAVPDKWAEWICADPKVRHGEACFKGTRIPVWLVRDFILDGYKPKEFSAEYPDLTADQAMAGLAYALDAAEAHIKLLHGGGIGRYYQATIVTECNRWRVAEARVAELERLVDEAWVLAKGVEHGERIDASDGSLLDYRCSICRNPLAEGHAPGCRIVSFLAKTAPEEGKPDA